jgi:hypothetical protein
VEIRCDNCSHVGPAAEVRPGQGSVVLVCENCGHENLLSVGEVAGAEAAPTDAGVQGEVAGDQSGQEPPAEPDDRASSVAATATAGEKAPRSDAFGNKEQVRVWLREDALEALIPESGDGVRCRKCARLLPADAENCARCGLNRREAERYAPGEAPWEQPPADKEAEHEQAMLLWDAFADAPDDEASLDKFVDFVRDEGLLDTGVRKLRFYLVDHPDDTRAVDHLRDLAESLQSKLIVAQVQAKASANEFQEDVSRFKQRFIISALVFWGLVFLLFLALFWDACPGGMPSI